MKTPKPCPGCRRDRADCWIMPCLYLEVLMRKGRAAVAKWARAGGGRVVPLARDASAMFAETA